MPEPLVSQAPRDVVIDKGLEVIAQEQAASGAWKGDYGGPLFLVPIYLAGLHALGESTDPATRDGFVRFIRAHQNEDGGWGLDVESRSFVFTSVLNYVALRLLGVSADDPALRRARTWFLPLKGAPPNRSQPRKLKTAFSSVVPQIAAAAVGLPVPLSVFF